MTPHTGKFVAYYRVSTDKQGQSGLGAGGSDHGPSRAGATGSAGGHCHLLRPRARGSAVAFFAIEPIELWQLQAVVRVNGRRINA